MCDMPAEGGKHLLPAGADGGSLDDLTATGRPTLLMGVSPCNSCKAPAGRVDAGWNFVWCWLESGASARFPGGVGFRVSTPTRLGEYRVGRQVGVLGQEAYIWYIW